MLKLSPDQSTWRHALAARLASLSRGRPSYPCGNGTLTVGVHHVHVNTLRSVLLLHLALAWTQLQASTLSTLIHRMLFCLLTFVFIPIFNATDGESPTLMTGAGVHEH
jgi:hypothetical protein